MKRFIIAILIAAGLVAGAGAVAATGAAPAHASTDTWYHG